MARRVLLLLPVTTYKSRDFLEAADRLGVEVVVGSNRRQSLEDVSPGHTLTLSFSRPDTALEKVLAAHAATPFDAVIAADDEATLLATRAAAAMSLPHNPEGAVRATRDKHRMRCALSGAGLRGPGFRKIALTDNPDAAAEQVDYPCVLKPLSLSAGRGVLRADDAPAFVEAFHRIVAIVRGTGAADLLVEDFLPGAEVAAEGLLSAGRLRVLALFDKPDPLEGPTFEETLYVTPSRLPESLRSAILGEVAHGCAALGLCEGPVHAELRLHEGRPWVLEVAARTIGGLCSRSLRFGTGVSLEELVLRHALGLETDSVSRERPAAGVMMIPIPARGVLREVVGLDRARAVEGIEEVTLTLHVGSELVPLPEGNQYLGFIFARGGTPERVEAALRRAHGCLGLTIG